MQQALTREQPRDGISLHAPPESPLAERLARYASPLYSVMVACLALPGYAVLFMLPVLTVTMLVLLGVAIFYYPTAITTITLAVLATLLLLAISGCMILARKRLQPPAGVLIERDDAPRLFWHVSQLRAQLGTRAIQRVIVTRSEQVRVVRSLNSLLPASTTRTLEIGLPVLLSTSPRQFRTIVARAIALCAGRRQPFTSWILQTDALWKNLDRQLAGHDDLTGKLLASFFRCYAPLFSNFAIYACRRAQLASDQLVMELLGVDKTADMVMQQSISKQLLLHDYWPMAVQRRRRGDNEFHPYRSMTGWLRQQIASNERLQRCVARALLEDDDDGMPGLQARLANIGVDEPFMPAPLKQCAGKVYLGTKQSQACCEQFDSLWLKLSSHLDSTA